MPTPANPALIYENFRQAFWNLVADEEIDDHKMGIGTLRYCNFLRSVRLDAVHLPCALLKRPRHLKIDCIEADGEVRAVADVELPTIADGQAHEIELGGLVCRHLRFTCLSHYLSPPSMYDQWAAPHNTPYSILDGLLFSGEYTETPGTTERCDLPVGQPLMRRVVQPVAPAGMTLKLGGNQVRYFGARFSVGFSLQRPLLTHMGWDAIGDDDDVDSKAATNLIRNAIVLGHGGFPGLDPNMAGPHWRTPVWTAFSSVWGGEISVQGNVVKYSDLNVGGEVTIDATFTVHAEGMTLQLHQRTATNRPTLELEAWRFIWNAPASAVATLATPICRGRTGAAKLPLVWSAPGHGTLSCAVTGASGPVRVQADSHRAAHITFAGLVLGSDQPYDADPAIPGTSEASASFEFRLEPMLPLPEKNILPAMLHAAIRREWASGLMFRPELAGFSNNALSTNCHLSQSGVVNLACCTAPPERGPHPVELARHTIGMALKEGRGYGDWREVYLDSDPSLLIGAGRVYMAEPNEQWLAEIWPWLRRTALRHLGKCAPNGLATNPLASGNRGDTDPFLPTNAYDTINTGHFDGYSNALTYRAFKNVAGLAAARGDSELQQRAAEAADLLKANYRRQLWSDASGWLGSWRSRDGELHDYGMVTQNAMACLYGLVSETQARDIIARMEDERARLGIADSSLGFPAYLKPIPMYDQMPFAGGTGYRADGLDAYGIYCNGTLTLGIAEPYLWALARFGPVGSADRACQQILDAHLELDVVGGEGTGCEFHTHEGIASGYEGAYVLQFPVLLAIAQHLGWARRSEPEFWVGAAEG